MRQLLKYSVNYPTEQQNRKKISHGNNVSKHYYNCGKSRQEPETKNK